MRLAKCERPGIVGLKTGTEAGGQRGQTRGGIGLISAVAVTTEYQVTAAQVVVDADVEVIEVLNLGPLDEVILLDADAGSR